METRRCYSYFKKGSKTNHGNYRPVSLTSVVCKVLESFIRDSVQEYMESLNLYSPCQHGFRKNRSCVTQLLEVIPFCISMCKYAVTSNESRSSLVIFFFFLISCLTHHRVSTDNWLLFPLWCYGFSNFNEEIILSKKF